MRQPFELHERDVVQPCLRGLADAQAVVSGLEEQGVEFLGEGAQLGHDLRWGKHRCRAGAAGDVVEIGKAAHSLATHHAN